jgi:putative ABC transport system permease protein
VPALGLRRAERQAGTGHLPLLVLLLTIAIGTFSSTMLATIDTGQATQSWQSVGAAYRVSSDDALPAELDVAAIPGVDAVAGVHETDASLGIGGTGLVHLIAVDHAEYAAVTAGTPAETRFPSSFAAEVDPYCLGESPTPEADPPLCPGTTRAPIPIIVSRALARESTAPMRAGDTFQLTISGRFATFEVVELRDAILGQPAGREFMVVPRDLLRASMSDRRFADTSLFVRAPEGTAELLRGAVAEVTSLANVESQAERLAVLRERPLVEAVGIGFALALAAAVAYAALAVIVALLMSGSARARETAHLRTMGIGRGQVSALTILEHGPPVLVAVVAGLALGIAVAWVVLPGLGLSAFTGSAADPRLTMDIGQLAVLTGALIVIVGIGVAAAAWMQQRADPALAVRAGLE